MNASAISQLGNPKQHACSVPEIWEHLKHASPSWTHFRIFDDFQKMVKMNVFLRSKNVDKSRLSRDRVRPL